MKNTISHIIEREVLTVIRKYGMEINDEDYWEYQKKQMEIGKNLWEGLLREVLSDDLYNYCSKLEGPPYYSEVIPYISAFGYTLARQLYHLVGIDAEYMESVALTNSLFNTFVGLFDRVCDERTDLYPDLIERVSYKSLLCAMDARRRENDRTPCFVIKPGDDPDLVILLKIMEEYFIRCRRLYGLSNNSYIWIKFKKIILVLYESEVKSTELNFISSNEFKFIFRTLRNKSSLPGWAICLTIMLPASLKPKQDINRLKEYILRLGDVFWIMDDIVDSVDDLENGRWSYTWFKLASGHGVDMGGKEVLLNKLIEYGIIPDAANDLCKAYLEVKKIFGFGKGNNLNDIEGLETTVLADIKDSFDAL